MKLLADIHVKFLLVFILLVSKIHSTAQGTIEWIGSNLTGITYLNGNWYYRAEDWSTRIQVKDLKYYSTDDNTLEPRSVIPFTSLDPESDTLILTRNDSSLLFIKKDLVFFNCYQFDIFEYAIQDSWGTTLLQYALDRNHILRITNQKKEVLLETQLNLEKQQEFTALLQKIDICSLNKIQDWRSVCDNEDYRFTFRDVNNITYQYIAMYPRPQLQPIQKFMTTLWPN